jgi:hypothetical protein
MPRRDKVEAGFLYLVVHGVRWLSGDIHVYALGNGLERLEWSAT